MINKADEENAGIMSEKISKPEMIACVMPQKKELQKAGLTGEPLEGQYEEIQELIKKIA